MDGSTHWTDDQRAKDERRDRWLAGQGIKVLRLEAAEVYSNLSRAADAVILAALARIRRC